MWWNSIDLLRLQYRRMEMDQSHPERVEPSSLRLETSTGKPTGIFCMEPFKNDFQFHGPESCTPTAFCSNSPVGYREWKEVDKKRGCLESGCGSVMDTESTLQEVIPNEE